jgi:hypothetical protein
MGSLKMSDELEESKLYTTLSQDYLERVKQALRDHDALEAIGLLDIAIEQSLISFTKLRKALKRKEDDLLKRPHELEIEDLLCQEKRLNP